MNLIQNTFGLNCSAKNIVYLSQLTSRVTSPYLILGNCSNTILPPLIDIPCMFADDNSVELIKQDESHYYIKVGAAYNWHKFVELTVMNNWYGLENLILIPGSVGAAPVQNIGAYGSEISDNISKVYTTHLPSLKKYELTKKECNFSYRNSIFKAELNEHIITAVEFKLNKVFTITDSHKEVQQAVSKNPNISPIELANTIKKIRTNKLPDPNKIGNVGSFFKNPIVPSNKAIKNIPAFKINDDWCKLSAAALIEQAGLKGLKIGGAAVSKQHALVIINENNASYQDVIQLSKAIKQQVLKKYDIMLENEAKIICPTNAQLHLV